MRDHLGDESNHGMSESNIHINRERIETNDIT